MKYVIVVGGSMSGLGKGITASSIGVILQSIGRKVTFIKIDPYINVDAGNLSPYDHGEVFVLSDGSQVDLDFGTYERFLGIHLTGSHSITTGKVYNEIINRERRCQYLGKTVQIVPHLTNLICEKIINAANIPIKSSDGIINPDTCIIEVGGTVGDIESQIFIEALRELKMKVGFDNFITISVNFIPILGNGEQKSKLVQNSVKQSMMFGLKPNIIVCRCDSELQDSIKDKLMCFCEVERDSIIWSKQLENTFELPYIFDQQNLTKQLIKYLNIKNIVEKYQLKLFYSQNVDIHRKIVLGIVGKYVMNDDCYHSLVQAIKFSSKEYKVKTEIKWIDSVILEEDSNNLAQIIDGCDGVIVPGGFGTRGVWGKILAINYCRENNVPILGICLGFQLMVIEFCRNVLKIENATSEEFGDLLDTTRLNEVVIGGDIKLQEESITDIVNFYDEYKDDLKKIIKSDLKAEGIKREKILSIDLNKTDQSGIEDTSYVIKYMPLIKDNQEYMRLGDQEVYLKENSLVSKIYKKNIIVERFRHRYGADAAYINNIEKNGMFFSGVNPKDNRMEICEISDHMFFVGVQFHPEFLANPKKPHPLFSELINVCLKRKHSVE